MKHVAPLAAGYEVWASRIAHVGVVTGSASRRRRLGTSCVGVVTRHALVQGLVAQFRTLCSNAGALAVALSLGFVEYGATIYVAATPDQRAHDCGPSQCHVYSYAEAILMRSHSDRVREIRPSNSTADYLAAHCVSAL